MSNIVKSKFVGLLKGLLRRYDHGDESPVMPAQPADAAPSAPPSAPYQQGSYLRTAVRPGAVPQSKTQPLFPKPQTAFAPRAAAPVQVRAAGQDILQLPLSSIVAVLPMDLRAKLTQTPSPTAMVSIPAERILSQLATGSVKMTFGELRAAHTGLFPHCGAENDARQFALPLQEILSRVNPALLSRRASKKMEVSEDEIPGPFSSQMPTTRATPAQVPPRPAAPLKPAAQPSATPRIIIPIQSVPPTASKNGTTAARPLPASPAAPAPAAPAANGFNSAPKIPMPQNGVEDSILVSLSALAEKWPDGIKQELVQAGLSDGQAALPAAIVEPGLKSGRVLIAWKNLRTMVRPKPLPASANDGMELELPLKVLAPLFLAGRKVAGKLKPATPSTEEIPDLFFGDNHAQTAEAPVLDLDPAPLPAPVVPAPAAPAAPEIPEEPVAPAAPVALQGKSLSAPLSALMEKWPEAVLREIDRLNLTDAQIAMPVDALAPAVKRGQARFPWRKVRLWIRPTPITTPSPNDSMELDLPLKVVAPLFLQHEAPPIRRHSTQDVDDSIPNFFFDIPTVNTDTQMRSVTPASPSKSLPPAPKPLDFRLSETNYYTWGDTNDAPQVDVSQVKRSITPGTDFTSRYATPKEVVARAAAVPGVAGAVVALFDGLAIASELPEELNADTVAAFLPQIFTRTSQSTKELRMGELNNLSFTVGNVPWVIFCVSSVYFAAFGAPNGALPVATLAALAKQLDRRNK